MVIGKYVHEVLNFLTKNSLPRAARAGDTHENGLAPALLFQKLNRPYG